MAVALECAMKPKIYKDVHAIAADVPDGARIMFGGFGGAGFPNNLIQALAQRGTKDIVAPIGRSQVQRAQAVSAARWTSRPAPRRSLFVWSTPQRRIAKDCGGMQLSAHGSELRGLHCEGSCCNRCARM